MVSLLASHRSIIAQEMTTDTTVLVLSVYCTDVEQTSLNLCMLYIIFICIKNIQSNSFFFSPTTSPEYKIKLSCDYQLEEREQTETQRGPLRRTSVHRHASHWSRSHYRFGTRVSSHHIKAYGKHMSLFISWPSCIWVVWWRRKRPIYLSLCLNKDLFIFALH